MNKLIIAVALLLVVRGGFGFWTPCPGGVQAPNTITSEFCTDTVCTVQRGSSLIAEALITAEHVHHHLYISFSYTFLGLRINFTVPEEYRDACTQLRNARCPTVIGNDYIWDLYAPIATHYPALNNIQVRGEKNLRWGDLKNLILVFQLNWWKMMFPSAVH